MMGIGWFGVAGCVLLLPLAASAALRLDIRDFGAVGDGLHDDTDAIQKSLDRQSEFLQKEVKAYKGVGETAPEVYIPKGCWRVTRPLVGGRTTYVTGESGSVLDGTGLKGPILYVHLANRCRVSGMHFKGGENHLCYWTANQNAATLIIEDCLFEQSEKEAVFTESYQEKVAKDWIEDGVMENKSYGPYDLSRDEKGRPILKRTTYPHPNANSTLFVMRHCGFKECGAMYRGYTDGQYFSDIRYLSTRAQTLPVIDTSTEFEMTDAKLTANIPKGYPHAWVTGKSPNVFLERVTAVSSSPYGAPLVSTRRAPREENFWAMPRHGWIEDCVVSAANSPSDVLIDFKRTPMAILYVHNCREAQGRNIRLLNVGSVPRNYREMLSSGKPGEEEELPEALTHRWLFDGNGPEIDCTVPKIFQKCLEKPIPSQALVGYPDIDLPVSQPTSGPYQVFSGEDYGLGLERPDADETAALQKLVDATAGAHNPLVLLPGRPIRIDGTVRLPRRITVRAAGFAVLVGRNDKDAADFFRVAGEDLAIAFEDVGFWNGRRMFDVRGSGRVYVEGATAKGNRGYRLERRGAKLAVDVFATTMIGPQFVENDGADLRVRDSWMQFEASPMTCVCCINRRGTLLFEHICGVPVSKGVVWASRERRKEIPAGEHYFWIRNEGGIVRSRNFRYGGEYGGVSILDNYADGRALLESQIACFVNFSGALSVFRNSDPEGEVVLNRVKFVVDDLNRVKIGRGVRPRVFYRSGDRWEKDHFDR